ncbi:sulfite exporter TauE/SafE family protein [Weissella koreensis]|uniref:Probable membrane transporter protein n=1 Tax=Weissella koreensis TaxID=165096 RepID=A0A7H1MKJ7_9LACO|nr:sulfite exporter TauE/SafE family protein [Weissella koreensis]AVH74780.1 sulfite exporter TauE/SafE family protein [Weissella koreensis]EJF33685.1 permease [Weissella koreensis KCTC 3621]EJF34087.1 permease [Weissella koreensis KCTC 3621]QGN20005.1 TSUP family transporter [Weissella koreensis]QNT63983.1 sulfite exporter TauE/SafE family protein [Weissella koreensis]
MLTQAMIMLLVGVIAGLIGSILGLGGGILITPALTLMGVDIKYAIAASIIAVIATSSGSSIAFLKDDVLNLRVAMFLEIFTTVGALIGALLTGYFNGVVLYFLFGALLIFQAWNMWKKLRAKNYEKIEVNHDDLAEKLQLNGSYYDKNTKKYVSYSLKNVPGGAAVMFGAGIASGLLGIGSGAFKVMAMDGVMKMPLKPSTSTSNLMMGVTAAASAVIYFFSGMIQPVIAVPIALGIIVGSSIGARLMQHLPAKLIRQIFIPFVLLMALQLILKGLGIG